MAAQSDAHRTCRSVISCVLFSLGQNEFSFVKIPRCVTYIRFHGDVSIAIFLKFEFNWILSLIRLLNVLINIYNCQWTLGVDG